MELRNKRVWLTRLDLRRAGIAAVGLIFGLFPSLITAQESQPTIIVSVVDADSKGTAVPSEIVKLPPADGVPQAETNEKGKTSLTVVCSQDTRIQARPISDAYAFSRKVFCKGKNKIEFKVTSIKVFSRLQKNLKTSLNAKEFGVAAHIANELLWTEPRKDKGVAGTDAERDVYKYSAQKLGAAESSIFRYIAG